MASSFNVGPASRTRVPWLVLVVLQLACPENFGSSTASDTSTAGSTSSTSDPDGTDGPTVCGDGVAGPGEFCFEPLAVPEVEFPIDVDAVKMDGGYSFVAVTLGDAMLYRVAFADATFTVSPVAPMPLSAESRIHVAELHSTGREDVVVTSIVYPWVDIAQNLGTELQALTSNSVGAGPGVLIDAEGDGIAELITSGYGEAFLWKYDPNTDKWAQQLPEYAVHGCRALWASVTADFDGDSRDDVAYIGAPKAFSDSDNCADVGFHRISVAVSDPQFGYPVAKDSIPLDFFPDELGAGDFDGDGKLDLAVVSSDVQMRLAVLAGLGDGTFAAPVTIDGVYQWLAVGNLDGDPQDEIVTNNGLLVLIDSPFTTPVIHELDISGRPHKIADVNADGVGDVAFAGSPNAGPTALAVLLSSP